MKIRKISAALLAVIMCAVLMACGMKATSKPDDKLSIVATIFPEYDWVREIMGDRLEYADVTMLLDEGVDLHSYQPTAEDILTISGCDIFIYVGGESDEWVEDVIRNAANSDMKVINLLDILGDEVKEEEIVEGMESDKVVLSEDSEESEYDEHVWLSLRNAQIICRAIAEAIKEKDLANADIYESNVQAYNKKLADLDEEYRNVVDAASNKTLLFGDRFPFRYLTDDYGITYYAAFAGCSAESEASFETIMFLANKVDELGLTSICTIEDSDQRIAETIKDTTKTKDQDIIVIDSLQSTTSADIDNGKTYLSTMTDNLESLREALSVQFADPLFDMGWQAAS